MKKAVWTLKILFATALGLLLAAAAAALLVFALGAGAPAAFLIYASVVLLREPASAAPGRLLRAGAILAVFRLAADLSVARPLRDAWPDSLLLAGANDLFFAACALWHGIAGLLLEAMPRWRLAAAARGIPATDAALAAPGLVHLDGVVRSAGDAGDGAARGRPVLSFYWNLIGSEPEPGDVLPIGAYHKHLAPFVLEDGTGRILVDPDHPGVELRRPLVSALAALSGRKTLDVVLTKRVTRPSWECGQASLNEGDRVRVIGTLEAPSPGARPCPGLPRVKPGEVFLLTDGPVEQARRLPALDAAIQAGRGLFFAAVSAALALL